METKDTSVKNKFTAGVATAMSIHSLGRVGYDYYKKMQNKRRYSMTLGADAYIYDEVMTWLYTKVDSKSVKVVSHITGISLFYDSESETKIDINGHKIGITLFTPDLDKMGVADAMDLASVSSPQVTFSATTREGQNAVAEWLENITTDKNKRSKNVYLHTHQTYGWAGKELPHRDLDSVFLRNGEMDSLLEDIDTFLDNEEHYKKIGIPYHRGYLLYGPPGNGKTSLVSAIAHHYKMTIHSLSLSNVVGDKQLADAVSNVASNSILLIEDVDIFSKSMGREQSKDSVAPTLNGLLNSLDGLATPHGLLTFMTTNHVETLDPALVRPGRMDYKLELVGPDEYQIRKMFEYVYNEPLNTTPKEFSSMAAVSNVFKTHRLDIEGARMAIKGE